MKPLKLIKLELPTVKCPKCKSSHEIKHFWGKADVSMSLLRPSFSRVVAPAAVGL
jgi:hypothetical protein